MHRTYIGEEKKLYSFALHCCTALCARPVAKPTGNNFVLILSQKVYFRRFALRDNNKITSALT